MFIVYTMNNTLVGPGSAKFSSGFHELRGSAGGSQYKEHNMPTIIMLNISAVTCAGMYMYGLAPKVHEMDSEEKKM